MPTGMPSPYTAGGLEDFMWKTGLDGGEPYVGSDIWSMRHLFRLQDERKRSRVITISLRDFCETPGPAKVSEGHFSGEQFRKDRLAPALRQAISTDRYVNVALDTTAKPAPEFLAEVFGGIARESEGFTPEQLTERLSALFVTERQTYFGREAIDHLHMILEERLRAGSVS
ncbi:hypothetical protein OIU34_18525 [Pararhizobium sp. BT-229]|uniref:hypothetical protein n=1 Tax=Pararhizobium sp. BT-229 TaxID=2986923 RepID=UPI0021F6C726|nr:hypothetical protein [Pararhizobium sp. BT-229]MCV9963875.1 hypothetical protein [Pararhizobium sp. BT-229]